MLHKNKSARTTLNICLYSRNFKCWISLHTGQCYNVLYEGNQGTTQDKNRGLSSSVVLSSLSRFGCRRRPSRQSKKKDDVVCLCTVPLSMRRVPIEQEVCAGQGGESANSEREEGLRTPQPLHHTVRARCMYNRTCTLCNFPFAER